MADIDNSFLHLLQAHGALKSDPSQRREVATLIVDFVKQECAEVDFTAPTPETAEHVYVAPSDEDGEE